MLNKELDLSFNFKEKIRETEIQNLKIGGNTSLAFMSENANMAKPLFALEFLYSQIEKNPAKAFKKAQCADIISVKFDLNEDNFESKLGEIKDFLTLFGSGKPLTQKPFIFRGANNNDIDRKLIPFLAKNAPRESIIAFADEQTYEDIVPSVVEKNHILVLRTPIDINLAKELNILSADKGLSPERILIDPDMGGLGYGLDYGYSIIERIRTCAFEGDTMLNMPIIAFIGEESYRAKEAKADAFSPEWGDFDERCVMWEVAGASAMLCAGADIVVLWNEKSIQTLKGLI